jgi:hypothetical protein
MKSGLILTGGGGLESSSSLIATWRHSTFELCPASRTPDFAILIIITPNLFQKARYAWGLGAFAPVHLIFINHPSKTSFPCSCG